MMASAAIPIEERLADHAAYIGRCKHRLDEAQDRLRIAAEGAVSLLSRPSASAGVSSPSRDLRLAYYLMRHGGDGKPAPGDEGEYLRFLERDHTHSPDGRVVHSTPCVRCKAEYHAAFARWLLELVPAGIGEERI